MRGGDYLCRSDAEAVRPDWRRACIGLALPPALAMFVAGLVAWSALRFTTPLHPPALFDVLWPPRWERVAEQRRRHFGALAAGAIAAGDPATATVALFSAVRIGRGDPADNQALARIATLGGYHSLADDLHLAALGGHGADEPRRARAAVAWLDDLLIARRPAEMMRLACAELARPAVPRELWLRAFFEALSAPGSAAAATMPEAGWPHPSLALAVRARLALAAADHVRAAAALDEFSRQLPGPPARRFLALAWLELGDVARARAAAADQRHPDPMHDAAVLAYEIEHAAGRPDVARALARQAWARTELRPALRAALIRRPDARLVGEWAADCPDASALAATWLGAKRAGDDERASALGEALGAAGYPPPTSALDRPAERDLIAAMLPLDREALWALRVWY